MAYARSDLADTRASISLSQQGMPLAFDSSSKNSR